MSPQDFLRRDVATELHERYLVAGAMCSLSTNCEHVLEAARESFLPVESALILVDF